MKHYAEALIGKTVKSVRSLNADELELMYWHETSDPTSLIEFTDGTQVIVMADPEGNGTGFLDILEA